MGMGHRGGDKGHLASHIPSRGDVAVAIPGLLGGGNWGLLDPRALGCAGGCDCSSPPSPPCAGGFQPPRGAAASHKTGY